MPTPFPRPPQNRLSYLYFGHVTFALSDGQSLVIIDPFFSGKFTWKNKIETHLEAPTIAPQDVTPVNAVLVSHEHGDHWDKPSMEGLLRGGTFWASGGKVIAPRTTQELMKADGLDISRYTEPTLGAPVKIGNLTVTCYPSIESENQPGPVQRVGFLVEAHGAAFYHQGDSHGPAKAWQAFKPKLDAMVIWPIYVDTYVTQMRPPTVVFHHMDRFTPGDFFCNKDATRELDYWRYRYPQTRFVSPARNIWYDAKTHNPV